jgi:transcriptional regulator with GAF, ATPase, and Fis domain
MFFAACGVFCCMLRIVVVESKCGMRLEEMSIREIEFFREMILRVCGTLDIQKALSDAFAYLREHVPADTMGLGYNNLEQDDRDEARMFVVAKVCIPGARYIWKDGLDEVCLAKEVVGYVGAAATDSPTVTIFNRIEDMPLVLRQVFPGVETDSALFLRLEVQDGMPGFLLLSAKGSDRYSPKHASLLNSVRESLAIAMTNARRFREVMRLKDLLAEDNRALAADLKRSVGVEVVGADFGLRTVMEQARQVASSRSPTLLLGETGTGKEVIANAIHMASPRSVGPMISMQCGAIPETLLDSELFGYEKGAFTGATERRRGRFERAHLGTLFLDEIAELSPGAQVKLLRVLQERKFERIGGVETLEVDVRVIAATHRDLEKMVREGRFREDLWYRLNVFPIRIPPLRLRREDIPSLIRHFVERKAKEMNLSRIPGVSEHDMERLKLYDWPGNVRELQNVVERALILSYGDTLFFSDFVFPRTSTQSIESGQEEGPFLSMEEAIAAHIRAALEKTRWKVSGPGGAAELLDMNASTLRFRMQKLGIHRKSG